MTRNDICNKYEKEIKTLSTLLKDDGVDIGIAESIFFNAAMQGKIPEGDEPKVQAALAHIGGPDFWEAVHKELDTEVGCETCKL